MKKIITIAVICLLVMGAGSSALAAGGSTSGYQNGSGSTTQSGVMLQNAQPNQSGLTEMARNREQIRVNRAEIVEKRSQITTCAEELRQEVRALIQNRDNIDAAKMEQLRQAIRTLRQERLNLITEHQGRIQEQLSFFYQARLQRDAAGTNQALHQIQIEQQQRISDLAILLDNMQELLETL